MKRRILSMLLVVCMVVSMLATAAVAAPAYVDIEGHWGEEAIEYWSAEGIVGGVGEGRFNPDGLLTRAEAAAILARLLKLTDKADISKYTDCVAGEWYYDSIAKCVAAGIMGGTGANTMEPGTYLSRAQMFTMFCRATGIVGESAIGKYFVDYNETPVWAVESVNALVNQGYVGGTSATTLEPNALMTRASLVVMLRKAIAAYVTEGGKVEVASNGIVLIVTDEPTQIAFNSGVTNTGAVVTTQPNATVQVSGNFSGTIVTNQPNTTVSLSGLNGTVEVVANADNTKVVNAPAGTTVTSNNGAENVTVNNNKVDTNDSETVVAPTTPATPAPSYPTVTPHVVATAWTTDATAHWHICSWSEQHDYAAHTAAAVVYENVINATVDAAGSRDAVTYCSVCGYEMSRVTEPIEKLDHTCVFGDTATFAWADDYSSATATLTCTVATGCIKTVNAVITSEAEETTTATCVSDGEKTIITTYTATVTEGDKTYTDTKTTTATEADKAPGHSFNREGVCARCDDTEAEAMKFELAVASGELVEDNKGAVTATVYDDYSAVVHLPKGSVSPASVTVSATMKDVDSLGGADKTKSESLTINTGFTVGDQDLYGWLDEAYDFSRSQYTTVNVTINGEAATTYNMVATSTDLTTYTDIVARPSDIEDTRDAWQTLTGYVDVDEENADSYVEIALGSYLQAGGQKLCFEDTATENLKLDNFSNLSDLESTIRGSVTLETVTDTNIIAAVAEGTTLKVGHTKATLNEDCVITVTGNFSTAAAGEALVALKNAQGATSIVKELIGLVNTAIGTIDGQTVNVDFTFGHFHKPAVITPATCTTAGVKGCCDVTEVIPATGHNFVDGKCSVCDITEAEALKFQIKVESGATSGDKAVAATVYDDYSATFVLPESTVNAASVIVSATMKDVASLGGAGKTKSESLTINTGITGKENVALAGWLSDVYTFETASAVVNVAGAAPFTYTLAGTYTNDGSTGTVITATPSDVVAARAAWQALTGHVLVEEVSPADSYIFIAQGSSLTMGGASLCFEDTDVAGLTLNNFNDMSALKETIKSTVKVEDGLTTTGIVAVLKAGTKLAVGNTVATLKQDVTIQVTGITEGDIDGLLIELRTAMNESSMYNMLNKLVTMVNDVVAAMDGENVVINVTFG